jgi:hypothetical protein
MRGGELDRDIGGRERFVLGKDDAACDSALRFSRAFFLR